MATSSVNMRNIVGSLFRLNQTERLWHVPLMASLCTGLPLIAGLYFDQLRISMLASISGLVILYLPTGNLLNRMVTMLACSFGFMLSFTTAVLFSFNPWVSSVMFGLLAFMAQLIANRAKMKPPGSFFFIMIASIAANMPFELQTIPTRVGVLAMGSMFACLVGMTYSLYSIRRYPIKQLEETRPAAGQQDEPIQRSEHTGNDDKTRTLVQPLITGIFMTICMVTGHVLELNNPYWVPISCLAVIQGVSLHHIWQRVVHRLLGTFVGLGLAWVLLLQGPGPLGICITLFVLQFIVEMFIVRHYALAVVFLTPLTLLLAEVGSDITTHPNALMPARFLDIALGSLIGAVAGWFLYRRQRS